MTHFFVRHVEDFCKREMFDETVDMSVHVENVENLQERNYGLDMPKLQCPECDYVMKPE